MDHYHAATFHCRCCLGYFINKSGISHLTFELFFSYWITIMQQHFIMNIAYRVFHNQVWHLSYVWNILLMLDHYNTATVHRRYHLGYFTIRSGISLTFELFFSCWITIMQQQFIMNIAHRLFHNQVWHLFRLNYSSHAGSHEGISIRSFHLHMTGKRQSRRIWFLQGGKDSNIRNKD